MNVANSIIIELLHKIEGRLDKIEDQLNEMARSNKKISKHVDFVEQTYEQVQRPFHRIMSIGNYIGMSEKTKHLTMDEG